MARARGTKAYVDMSGGIITEASPVDFPQNASSDELNMLFDKSERKRVRREGVESGQEDFSLSRIVANPLSGYVYDIFYWRGANRFVVPVALKAVSNTRYVIRIHDPVEPYALKDEITVATGANDARVTLTEVRGNLVVVVEDNLPAIFVKSDSLPVAEVSTINLFVRDFKLLDDGLNVTERPPVLSEEHQYNLLNAGWYQDRFNTDSANTRRDPIEYFFNNSGSVITANGDFVALSNTFTTTSSSVAVFNNVLSGTSIDISGTVSNNGTFSFQSYNFNDPNYVLTFDSGISDEAGITATFTIEERGYPSNADIAYLGVVPNSDGDKLTLNASFLQDQTFGNTPAARGHYVYNINDFDRNARLLNKNNDGAVENTLTPLGTVNL